MKTHTHCARKESKKFFSGICKSLFIIFFQSFGIVDAQTNLDFETWNTIDSIESAVDWTDLNIFSLLGDSISTKKTSDAFSGKFAIKIRPILIQSKNKIIPGSIFQKASIAKKPEFFHFAYKLKCIKSDSSYFKLTFYGQDSLNKMHQVGLAEGQIDSSDEWSTKKILIKWKYDIKPSSVTIYFFTNNNTINSWLFLDSIYFTYPPE